MQNIQSRLGWIRRPPPSLSMLQKHWMMRPGALTAGLRQLGNVRLNVIREYAGAVCLEDSYSLHLPRCAQVWTREIYMSIDDIPCVVARSVTPLRASHGVWQGVRRLKSRPLADILYQRKSITRTNFDVQRLLKSRQLTKLAFLVERNLRAKDVPMTATHQLCARRSVFWRSKTPLLVSECFLPIFWELAVQHNV